MKFFPEFDDDSRLWVFLLSRSVSGDEQKSIRTGLEEFFKTWNAHGAPVEGAAEFLHGQFLLIVASKDTEVSGCSIDSLFRAVKEICGEASLELLSQGNISFLEADALKVMTQDEFRAYAESGQVAEDTIVFNNAVQTVSEFREGKWQLPFKDSWHRERFPF